MTADTNQECLDVSPSTSPAAGSAANEGDAGAVKPPFEHELPETFSEAAKKLLVTVHSRARREVMNWCGQVPSPDDPRLLMCSFAEHLALSVVHDHADTKKYLDPTVLEKWGVTFEDVVNVAFENLTALHHEFGWLRKTPGIYASKPGDCYDSARLLLPEVVTQMKVSGRYVAMLPYQNELFITGDQDTDGLRIMIECTKGTPSKPNFIGGFAFRLRDDWRQYHGPDWWQPWIPPKTHPVHEDFRAFATRTLAGYYHHQQQELHAADSRVFAASVMYLGDDKVSEATTCSMWANNLQTLLPKTDLIAVSKDYQPKGLVPWAVVARVMRDEMEPVGLYPERYRVHGYPTEGQLSVMVREARNRGISQERGGYRAKPR